MMDDCGAQGRTIRAPSLRRGKIEARISDRIKLEKVLGVTVASNAALASDDNGTIAYPAGCTVVLFNTKTEQQHHIINTNRKTLTSLAFSACGRYLVTGECGHQPGIRVWDLYSDPLAPPHPGLAPQPQQCAEFIGHKFGINCVAFSPSGKYVVSVGTQHDMIVNVWDWKNNIKVASNKVSTKVKSVAFAENGSYFVTVGNRHVKFWYLEYGKSKYKEAVPLMGRSAILGEQRNNYFCDVACGRGQSADNTYAITRSGLLCEFNNRRLLDKWVELRTKSANCIAIGEKYIFVGCAEGIVRCFDPTTLCFITTLPRTHYLGVDVALGSSIAHMATPPPLAKYPDTIALTYNETSHKLTSIYNDHSIYVWDVSNIKRVGKSFSFLYHSACIWGVEMPPLKSPFPSNSFLTCSSDDTIRVWNLDNNYKHNIYSNELVKIVYVKEDLSHIKDLDISAGNGNEHSYDGRNGVRCIRISPDGRNLASGDRSGNIRIHDTATMKEIYKIEAHDAEVLCLEYDTSLNLMASASRDRLLHVFDVKQGYMFRQTLDDHSSSITAVRFLNTTKNLQMVSCGADKSLIFRTLTEPTSKGQFVRENNAAGKSTLYDMEIDSGGKHVLTACQDRNVRIYSCNTGKHTRSFKGSTGDEGTLIKVVLDSSSIYLATSCTDKSLSVYDYYSGECMATMCGHSELATGLRFTNDCKHLISASGDGCIFVWKIPHDMVVTMHARLSQQAMRQGKLVESDVLQAENNEASYRFSVGQLPKWAKKQLNVEASPPIVSKPVPKGRWAQNQHDVDSFYSRLDRSEPNNDSFDEGGGSSSVITKEVLLSNINVKRGTLDFDDSAEQHEYRRASPLYYPNAAESPIDDYTVTNKGGGAVAAVVSQESDDDDEVSTPSGDNTDRNPMSLLSVSMESLDQLENREKYLQASFESMSGMEGELRSGKKSTISSKFLTRTSDVNMAAINAVKKTKSDPEAMKKRQMLDKRIAETKKKLENVGHSSPLKYSQSIHDLSHIPEQELSPKKQVYHYVDESSPDTSLRRSCSLSDLRMQKPVSKKIEVSGKKPAPKVARSQSSRYKKNNLARSKSINVLNQSDSEPETNSGDKKMSRLMRPTISSHNKITNKSVQLRHKKRSYSTSNLSQVGVDPISTSDEELEKTTAKPIPPPRNRHLNREARDGADSSEPTSVDIAQQLCADVIDDLTRVADNVVKLYNRFSRADEDDVLSNAERVEMVNKLELSMLNTHKVLHDAIFQKLKQSNGSVDWNQTDSVKKLNDLVAKGRGNPNSIVSTMEQYSDILLDMVLQKMHNSNI